MKEGRSQRLKNKLLLAAMFILVIPVTSSAAIIYSDESIESNHNSSDYFETIAIRSTVQNLPLCIMDKDDVELRVKTKVWCMSNMYCNGIQFVSNQVQKVSYNGSNPNIGSFYVVKGNSKNKYFCSQSSISNVYDKDSKCKIPVYCRKQ